MRYPDPSFMHIDRIRSSVPVLAAFTALLAAACSNTTASRSASDADAHVEEQALGEVRIDRITTVVPWPRGVRWIDGKLYALGRGVHRSAGGPQPDIDDKAGSIFEIDPDVYEPVRGDEPVGEAVRRNGRVLAEPTSPPFHLWNGEMPATRDTRTDRPYCMLVYDEPSRNFFVCGYSGLDQAKPAEFRKNATDSIHRFDMRDGRWHVLEQHDPDVVPESELKAAVDPRFYPHHDPNRNAPPHGLVNGACGAVVAGNYLYVGGKDNTSLAQYDLHEIRDGASAPPPPGRLIFHRSGPEDDVYVRVKGHGEMYVEGTCALGVNDGYLYVAFRTTSQILRFPLNDDGSLDEPLEGESIAQFPPYDPEKGGGSANIYDLTFDDEGRMYVSPGYDGAIYRFRPDPERLYDARSRKYEPYVDLEPLVGAGKSGNICLDPDGNLYICCGQNVIPERKERGVIYRVRPR